MGDAKHPSSQMVAELRSAISKLYDVGSLKEEKITELLDELVHAMGSYQAAENLRINIPAKSRGNKNKTHVQDLLQDCARAWSTITGGDITIWQKDPINKTKEIELKGHTAIPESISVNLARIVMGISSGKAITSNLRTQVMKARGVEIS
jgi:hypothetical protein